MENLGTLHPAAQVAAVVMVGLVVIALIWFWNNTIN